MNNKIDILLDYAADGFYICMLLPVIPFILFFSLIGFLAGSIRGKIVSRRQVTHNDYTIV